jgi:hypothetical protein
MLVVNGLFVLGLAFAIWILFLVMMLVFPDKFNARSSQSSMRRRSAPPSMPKRPSARL